MSIPAFISVPRLTFALQISRRPWPSTASSSSRRPQLGDLGAAAQLSGGLVQEQRVDVVGERVGRRVIVVGHGTVAAILAFGISGFCCRRMRAGRWAQHIHM